MYINITSIKIYMDDINLFIFLHRFVDPRVLSAIVDLAHTLWFTNLGQKDNRPEESSSGAEDKEKPQPAVKCLPLPLINEFLCVLLSVIKHLK